MSEGKTSIICFIHPQRKPPQTVINFWGGLKGCRTIYPSNIGGKYGFITIKDLPMFKDSDGNITFSCKWANRNLKFEKIEEGLIVGYTNE